MEEIKKMILSQAGLSFIKQFEGLRLKAYRDGGGVWTIGYGHTRTAKEGMIITEAGAMELLRDDVSRFEKCVNDFVKVEVTQNEFDALVSFAYNVGCNALKNSTLLKLLNDTQIAEAAEQFLRWNKIGGVISKGLTRRRKAERAIFLEEYKSW